MTPRWRKRQSPWPMGRSADAQLEAWSGEDYLSGSIRAAQAMRAEQDDDPLVKGSAERGSWEYATGMCGCPLGGVL
ncbi:hypothetical protein GQ55_5G168100 [Panicum hallii var. hallii]|uniref:Uncharacterized protein n=1 Tax=Panicum hallii var. hallii TaxID=1504633 RepID=A0A2T7DH38_9POAL|nr:hypothetical protein GQ55_5G168100 [Panicum hallii var. hallii]